MEKEKREDAKFWIEVAKLGLQIISLVAIAIAFFTYKEALNKSDQDTYRFIAVNWNDHLATFIDKPQLRPYFFEGKELPDNLDERMQIEAVADVRLDKMDAILTYFQQRGGSSEDIKGWTSTFEEAFRRGPVLCSEIADVEDNYGLIVPIARKNCPIRSEK